MCIRDRLLPYVMEYNAESPAAPKYIHIAKAMGVNTDGMTEAEDVYKRQTSKSKIRITRIQKRYYLKNQ